MKQIRIVLQRSVLALALIGTPFEWSFSLSPVELQSAEARGHGGPGGGGHGGGPGGGHGGGLGGSSDGGLGGSDSDGAGSDGGGDADSGGGDSEAGAVGGARGGGEGHGQGGGRGRGKGGQDADVEFNRPDFQGYVLDPSEEREAINNGWGDW